MHTVGAFEAKTHLSALLEEVQKGDEIIITKHGHPIAKIVPFTGVSKNEAAAAIQAIKTFNRTYTLGSLDWKKLRDAGRK